VANRTILTPSTPVEAADALADTSGGVSIRGAGTADDWAGRPEPADLVLDTTRLTGMITHNPGDMTVSVRAGTPLSTLNAELAAHGQRVALDAARVGSGATVGGLLATADSGPSALVHGSLRDLVIGTTVVLADGTIARNGGHVIKNVAGYDLAKLMHGCHGTLALVAEVVLRLHPLPAASRTLRLPCALVDAAAATRTVLASPLEPAAVEWFEDALLVRLTGTPAALEARASRLATLLSPAVARAGGGGAVPESDGTVPESDGVTRLAGVAEEQAWARHSALVSARPEPTTAVLRVGARPSRLPGLLGKLIDDLGATGVTAGLATGIATLRLPADPDTVERAHQLVHQAGGTSMLRSRSAEVTAPAWGPAPSAIDVLRATRTALDPTNRLGAGRFAPWM
jgi:glycolate oxidase FAD binding subunit